MLPIKNDLFQVAGSWTQRQVFNVTMIEAAVKSNDIPTALGLVAELHARKPNNRTLQVLFKKLKESYISENQLKSKEKHVYNICHSSSLPLLFIFTILHFYMIFEMMMYKVECDLPPKFIVNLIWGQATLVAS